MNLSIAEQSAGKTATPYRWAIAVGSLASVLVFAALLRVLGVPLIAPALIIGAATLLWVAYRYPIFCLGAMLVFLPVDPLALLIARFYGPPFMMSDMVKAADRIILLIPILVLWRRNGIKLTTPDWLLVVCLGLAALRFVFGGAFVPLIYDWDFVIAYVAGRVAVLTLSQQESWAKRAVLIAAVLSVLGMVEVFVLGEGPRTLLYLAAEPSAIENGGVIGGYHVHGFAGVRLSSTMGPLQFGGLCMVALVLWWVYRRNPVPAVIIAAGLILTVARSAWVGGALAISLLGVLMHQRKRLLLYASLALALLLAAIPAIGLDYFVSATVKGEEASAQGHKESLLEGATFVLSHPFGLGPGKAGTLALKNDSYIVWTENSYLTLAEAYGIPTVLCFLGFLVSVAATLWSQRTRLAYAGIGILVGFSAIMMFLAGIHDVFSLAGWVWFPIGQAVRLSTEQGAYAPS